MKICKICGIFKSDSEFNRHPGTRDRLDSRCKECKKSSYIKNKDEILARQKIRRESNSDEVKARNRISQAKYLKKNKDACYGRIKDWSKRNPERVNVKTRNYVARKRNAEGSHTSQDIAEILLSQDGKCKACGVDVMDGYHVDHIVALINGGSNWPANLQILCPSCNTSKGAKDFDSWLTNRD